MKQKNMTVLLLVVISLMGHIREASCLRIGAFNVRIFGATKAADGNVMDALVKIIIRYDIILIQEIRDSSGAAIVQLLNLVNEKSPSPYSMSISERLGRTTSKEQYAYFYKPSSGISLTSSYTYDDGEEDQGDDLFEREPYIVKFNVIAAELPITEFAIAGLHTKPTQAAAEISKLQEVIADMEMRMGTRNIIVMGDLNADCSYMSNGADWEDMPLREDKDIFWLINDCQDTTTGATMCAYDRILLKGPEFFSSVIPHSNGTYYFDRDLGIDKDLKMDISDHYPVEFKLGRPEGKNTCDVNASRDP